MAKKRSKSKKPNLPQVAIDRARREVGGDDVDEANEPVAEAAPVEETPEPEAEESTSESTSAEERAARRAERRASRRSKSTRVSASGRTRSRPVSVSAVRRNSDELDNTIIEQMLANPTKTVSVEQMQEEYSYVLRDLRNMFFLTIILMIALVALAQFI